MVDALNAWWAQQLRLRGWAPSANPLTLSAKTARLRLHRQGITTSNELAAELLVASGDQSGRGDRWLVALEWAALGGAAGWISQSRAQAWAQMLIRQVVHAFRGLDDWLSACRPAGTQPALDSEAQASHASVCQALRMEQEEGQMPDWPALQAALAAIAPVDAQRLWPSSPRLAIWRVCALLRPVIEAPGEGFYWPDADRWLVDTWQIHDRDVLINILLWLSAQGDRQRWDIDAKALAELDLAQREEWRRQQQSPHAEVLHAFVGQGEVGPGETPEWAAWDWVRLAELALAGVCSGYLSEAEGECFAAHAVDLLTYRHADWAGMLDAFLRGQALFEGVDKRGGSSHRLHAALLEHPASPWQLPLDQLLGESLREASRERLREWRDSPYHWLLALTSVRDPEVVLCQGAMSAVPPSRRQEAGQFLKDVLGLHADEGAGALARYWLPAQSHHLNQLAADASHGVMPPAQCAFGTPPAVDAGERRRLAGIARHAASILMAEKFAFYLYMALESEWFDHAELMRLVEALKNALCRFYSGPEALLGAWLAWETCIPESDEVPLKETIAWHLHDPGSLFYWLNWQPGAWYEPGPRPTLTRFTAMALAGPLNAAAWSTPRPESAREMRALSEWLDSHYHVQGSAELDELITQMLDVGDRQEYQINYAPYTLNRARLDSEIETLGTDDCGPEERQHLMRLERVRDNLHGCNDTDMAAWDIAQAVDLAIAGRQLDWLSESRLGEVLDQAHALAAKHYAGWQAYAFGMRAGFSFFMGETEEREAFINGFHQALTAWLCAAPLLAGPWASLDFPGTRARHFPPLHIDTLPEDQRTLH